MNNFDPAIDQVCHLLGGCTPGEAPGIVAEMVERQRVRPANEPPSSPHDVLVFDKLWGWQRGFYNGMGNWRTETGMVLLKSVTHWRELPPVPEVEK